LNHASSPQEALSFVSIEGLLAYGELLSRQGLRAGVSFPSPPPPTKDRAAWAKKALPALKAFSRVTYPNAAAYRAEKARILDQNCQEDALIFYAAWRMPCWRKGSLRRSIAAKVRILCQAQGTAAGSHCASKRFGPPPGGGSDGH